MRRLTRKIFVFDCIYILLCVFDRVRATNLELIVYLTLYPCAGFVSLGVFVKSGVVADMQITFRNGSGDVDMYHKAGGHPTDTVFDNSAATASSTNETIVVNNVQAGWNYVRAAANPSFSNVTALVRYLPTSGGGNVAPTAVANGPYSGAVNTNIAFNSNGSSDSDGSIASYNWNFGDGSATNTSANPSHSYASAGTFTVTLTVTDNDGATATDTANVTISDVVGPINLENACATQGPSSGSNVSAGNAICVPSSTNSNGIQYYYILVQAGTNSMTIETGHGTGNGNLYYNANTWATSSNYTQHSTNASNSESITVNNPAEGYRFFSVIGARSGMALKVNLQ